MHSILILVCVSNLLSFPVNVKFPRHSSSNYSYFENVFSIRDMLFCHC
jgi:hypothetical protein